jgi:hypothetical protein
VFKVSEFILLPGFEIAISSSHLDLLPCLSDSARSTTLPAQRIDADFEEQLSPEGADKENAAIDISQLKTQNINSATFLRVNSIDIQMHSLLGKGYTQGNRLS